ncbi:MAG: prolipoprotein diacylglyceryl transferase [Phycisphaeraceae bacterium]|nr:prolipoprotein diacylglyceryl transferase [Phycisphaeraceae bacterium]
MLITLAAWLHTLDPFLVRFTDSFGIRWYGLAYLAGFVVAYLIMRGLAKRGLILIPYERVGDALMWLIAGVLVGGRLGYALVYQRSLFVEFSSSPPWWGLLAINHGGMASHGGIVGAILASWRISRGWKGADGQVHGRCTMLHLLDVIGLVSPFGLLFGRLANFVNGELLGRIMSKPGVEGPWWTVQYPQELSGWVAPGLPPEGHTPVLSVEQQAELWALVRKSALPNQTFGQAVNHLIETAGRHAAELKPLLASRVPSQLLQGAAEGLVLGAVVWMVWYKPRKPGVVAGVWLAAYGVLRVVTEIWRLPDPQFVGADARPYGLSRGQWLSVVMVVGGLGLLWYSLTRANAAVGGWWRGKERAAA